MRKINMTIEEIIKVAVDMCFYAEILAAPKEREATIHVEEVIEAINILIEGNAEDENYEVCQLCVDAKNEVNRPDFDLDKFVKSMKYE